MRIDIWADVVCPWCYIGKRRLEEALAGFEHADDVEVVWRSYQLDPDAPRGGTETVPEMLGRRYGGGADAGRQMVAQVEEIAAGAGIAMDQSRSVHTNSLDAHRLLHLARTQGEPGAQDALKERLLAAYFVEGKDIADATVLTEAGSAVGLDAARIAEVLASDEYAEAVAADVAQARGYGANGVPFFVLGQRYAVSGAQPTEVFARALSQAWQNGAATAE